MAKPRPRPRISIGFAPGGRGNLIASLTPTSSDQRAEKRAQDQAKFNAFKRGDIGIAELETYIAGRAAAEEDKGYAATLTDALDGAKLDDAHRGDKSKIDAWRSGAITFAELEQYFAGRKSVNPRDAQDTQTLVSALRVEHTQTQDKQMLGKWKAGQASNSEMKAYLQGRFATAKTEEDRANLQGAMKSVDDKQRSDTDQKMAADYASGKADIREYTNYLVKQASRTDIAPEEAANYDAVRQKVEDNYNLQTDNKVYYEYLSGQRSYESARDYLLKRQETATPTTADSVAQRLAQVQDHEAQVVKAAQTAARQAASSGSANQSRWDSLVASKVSFAEKLMKERLKEAELIPDPTQRAQYIASLYQSWGDILDQASRSGSTDAGEYIARLRNVPNEAKLSIHEQVGKYETDRALKSNEADLKLAGNDSQTAQALAGNVARLTELSQNPFLSPQEQDRVTEALRIQRTQGDKLIETTSKKSEDLQFQLQQLNEELKAKKNAGQDTIAISARINTLMRDFQDTKTGYDALKAAQTKYYSITPKDFAVAPIEGSPEADFPKFQPPASNPAGASDSAFRKGERSGGGNGAGVLTPPPAPAPNPQPGRYDTRELYQPPAPSVISPSTVGRIGSGGYLDPNSWASMFDRPAAPPVPTDYSYASRAADLFPPEPTDFSHDSRAADLGWGADVPMPSFDINMPSPEDVGKGPGYKGPF